MRSSTLTIILSIGFLSTFDHASAQLAEHEETCSGLGFKKKTNAYGECVLELDQRQRRTQEEIAIQTQKEAQRPTQPQDEARADHNTCSQLGFLIGSPAHADCRLEISLARRDLSQRQAAFQLEQQRHLEEQRRYAGKVAEAERQKEKQKGEAIMRFGLALMGENSPHTSVNINNAARQSLGLPRLPPPQPILPAPPTVPNFTITSPSGRTTSCRAIGNNIHCF